MHLVDEEDCVAHLAHIIQQALDAAFKLSAELGTRHQRGHIEQVQLLALQHSRDVAVGQPLCNALGDGGLADTRLTDQAGIIFSAAVENLDDALDLLVPADDPIDLAVLCLESQVLTVGVEEFILLAFLLLLAALLSRKISGAAHLGLLFLAALIRLHLSIGELILRVFAVFFLILLAPLGRHVEHLHERHRLRAAHIKAVAEAVQQAVHLVIHRVQLLVGDTHLVHQVGHRLDVQLFGTL